MVEVKSYQMLVEEMSGTEPCQGNLRPDTKFIRILCKTLGPDYFLITFFIGNVNWCSRNTSIWVVGMRLDYRISFLISIERKNKLT